MVERSPGRCVCVRADADPCPRNDLAAAGTDLDLFVHGDDGNNDASSTGDKTSEELVQLGPFPDARNFTAWVSPYWTYGPTTFRLHVWVLPGNASGGSMEVLSAPGSAELGATGSITLGFSGPLDPAQRSAGVVSFPNTRSPPTVIFVSAPPPPPPGARCWCIRALPVWGAQRAPSSTAVC